MAAQQQRPPSSETLPAILSPSPPGSHRTSGRGMNESMTLPPIHSLTRELPTRLEPMYGDPHTSQKHSPPDSNGYHRKRSATGGIAGDMSPSSAFKRRRMDSSESTEQNVEPPYHSAPGSASDSHLPRQAKPPQQEQRDTQHLSPPLAGVAAHHQSSRGNVSLHEHRRHHSSGASNFAAQDHALKQEQTSPPAVVVQSPATPATVGSTNNASPAWSNESASFSRRISNASASLRPTQRKLPPSRLTFQTHNPQRSSLDATLPPSIRSAPPVPVPGQMGAHRPPPASNSTWLTNRPILPSRISNAGPATPDLPTPKAVSRESFPSIPTPTSLRLRSVLQPPLPPANPNLPPATSPSGRIPITPAVPSPIPTLGSGTGLADKAKFMAKMSEIYDKATLHKNCVTLEEVDRRIREALVSRDQELLQLKKEVFDLRKAFTGSTQANATPAGALDHDGDVSMGGNNPNTISQPLLPRAHSRQVSRTLSVSPRPSPHPIESTSTKESTAAPPNAKSPEEGTGAGANASASSSIAMPSVLPMANGKTAITSTNSLDGPTAGATAVKE
ncbi:hypothetical protein FRC19_004881 [Serendipita sp. 401]|nr:hypothetical protein FRC19_004881 [Serendipita sp. 401]KAG9056312.1 hypothetical protein FS842_011059 [Serendipita sp. 407]